MNADFYRGTIASVLQVLKDSGGRLLLIDLTEGRELSGGSDGGGGDAVAVARAFVAEVCGLIDAESVDAQARAAEALLAVLREAKEAGVVGSVSPALASALAEVRACVVGLWWVCWCGEMLDGRGRSSFRGDGTFTT